MYGHCHVCLSAIWGRLVGSDAAQLRSIGLGFHVPEATLDDIFTTFSAASESGKGASVLQKPKGQWSGPVARAPLRTKLWARRAAVCAA